MAGGVGRAGRRNANGRTIVVFLTPRKPLTSDVIVMATITGTGVFSGRTGACGVPADGGTWALVHRPEAAAAARKITVTFLDAWGADPETAGTVLLVVSELVTNAVEHARPPLVLHLHRDPSARQVRVGVTDGGPATREGDWAASCADDEHGRGLGIIGLVAVAHGEHQEREGGTTHWASLPMAA